MTLSGKSGAIMQIDRHYRRGDVVDWPPHMNYATQGYSVTVFEKNGEVRDREATRKCAGFIYDSGAQYIKGDDQASVSATFITHNFYLPDLTDIGKPVLNVTLTATVIFKKAILPRIEGPK